RRVTYLRRDAVIAVVDDGVALDQGVDVVQIQPKRSTQVVVHVVVAEDQPARLNELGPSCLKVEAVEVAIVAEGDLVVGHHEVGSACGGDVQTLVVVNVV